MECLAKNGQIDKATSVLANIPKDCIAIPDLYYLKGLLQLYGGNSDKAKQLFAEGVKLDPDNVKCVKVLKVAKKCEALKEEGNTAIKANNYDEAI